MSDQVLDAGPAHSSGEDAPPRARPGFDVGAAAARLLADVRGNGTAEVEDLLPSPVPLELEPGPGADGVEEVAPDDILELTPLDPVPAAPGVPAEVPEETAELPDVASLAPAPAAEPSPPAAPAAQRVVVHTREGAVRRALLADGGLAAAEVRLAVQDGVEEAIPSDEVKAVFFMLEPGAPPPPQDGRPLRVTFHDGRQLAGVSPDYDAGADAFFLVPSDARTRAARIWIPRAAARVIADG